MRCAVGNCLILLPQLEVSDVAGVGELGERLLWCHVLQATRHFGVLAGELVPDLVETTGDVVTVTEIDRTTVHAAAVLNRCQAAFAQVGQPHLEQCSPNARAISRDNGTSWMNSTW